MSNSLMTNTVTFTADQALAFWDGKKTQTRVPLAEQHWPDKDFEFFVQGSDGLFYAAYKSDDETVKSPFGIECPLGRPGDRFEVIEPWAYHPGSEAAIDEVSFQGTLGNLNLKWQPASTLPRDKIRTRPRIKSVRIDRLHNITERECQREGLATSYEDAYLQPLFRHEWEEVYREQGYRWRDNPYCWVINHHVGVQIW